MNRFTYEIKESVAFRWIIIYDKGVKIYEGEKDAISSDEVLLRKAKIAVNDFLSRSEGKDMMQELDKMTKIGTSSILTLTNNFANSNIRTTTTTTNQITSNNAPPPLPSRDQTKEEPYPGKLIKFGSRGDDVRKIQAVLNVKVDGIFGPQTLLAVQTFQDKNDLLNDGIVGPKTWKKLFAPKPPTKVLTDTNSRTGTQSLISQGFATASIANFNANRFDNLQRSVNQQATRNSLSTQFKKKLDVLKLKVLTQGLDITKYLLPDEQVAINFIREANPTFLLEDINIMIYGMSVNPNMSIVSNFKNTVQNLKRRAEQLAQNAQNLGERIGDAGSQIIDAGGQIIDQVRDIPQNASGALQTTLGNVPGINLIQGGASTTSLQNLGGRLVQGITQNAQMDAQQLLQASRFGNSLVDDLRIQLRDAKSDLNTARRTKGENSKEAKSAQIIVDELVQRISEAQKQAALNLSKQADEILNRTNKKYEYDIKEVGDNYEVAIKYKRFDDKFIEVGKKTFPKNYKQVVNGVELSGLENLEKVLQDEARKKGFFGFLKEQPLVQGLISQETTSQQILTLREQLGTDFGSLIGGLTSSGNMIEDAATARFNQLKKYNIFAPYPLPKDNPIYRNVKAKKEEMRNMMNKFFSRQEEIFNALLTALTQTSSAIPAITLIVSTPPFNVPAALSLISLVMAAINELTGKISPILDYIKHLQDLSLYVSQEAYKELVRITMPVVDLLTRLLDPISALKKFMSKLLEAIKRLFKGPSCQKQIRRINRQLRKKKQELKTLDAKIKKQTTGNRTASEEDLDDKEGLEEEIQVLQERLDSLKKDCGKGTTLEQDTTQLNQILQDVDTAAQSLISVVNESFVYDVQLPDGQNLIGISEQEFESLKSSYRIIMG